MGKKSAARLKAEELCEKYPHHGRRILADMLMSDGNPYLLTKDQAEGFIRRVRRKDDRRRGKTTEDRSELSGDWQKFIPNSDYTSPKHIRLESNRIGLLPDIHIPYHDADALSLAIEYLRGVRCDCIILAGDTMDCYGLSRFEKDPSARNMAGEIAQTRQFLRGLRMAFPDARILFKEGNHERRWQYMLYKNPQICELDCMQLSYALKLNELGIEYIGKRSMIVAGGHMKDGMPRNALSIIHGDEANINGGVNPARTLFLRMGVCAICGHLHRRSEQQESTADGKTISTWSMGCLCGRWPDYAAINKWTTGFADVEVDGEQFVVHNHSIINGRVF